MKIKNKNKRNKIEAIKNYNYYTQNDKFREIYK